MSARRNRNKKKVKQEVAVKEEPVIKIEPEEDFPAPNKGQEIVKSEPDSASSEEADIKTEPVETEIKSEPYASEE